MSNDTTNADPLADLELAEDLSSSGSFTPGDPLPMPKSARGQNALMDATEVAMTILEDCALTALSGSVCMSCARRVLVQAEGKEVTLYCSALYRDLEVSVTRCTAYEVQRPGHDSLQ